MNYDIGCGCKQCTTETGRSPYCHSTCEKYKHFRKSLDEVNSSKKMEREKDAAFLYRKPRRRKK